MLFNLNNANGMNRDDGIIPKLFVVVLKSMNQTTKELDIFESYCVSKTIKDAQAKIFNMLKTNYQPLYNKGQANGGWFYQHHFVIQEEEMKNLFGEVRGESFNIKKDDFVMGEVKPEAPKEKPMTDEMKKKFEKISEKKDKNELMKNILEKKDLDLFHSNIKKFEPHEVTFLNDKLIINK